MTPEQAIAAAIRRHPSQFVTLAFANGEASIIATSAPVEPQPPPLAGDASPVRPGSRCAHRGDRT